MKLKNNMKQEVLEQALEAFWAEIAKNHPERETGDLSPNATYDLENWAQHAYECWLDINKPVYYVQRTIVQVLKVTGLETPEEAVDNAADIPDPDWFADSLDTTCEYIALDKNGKQV